MSSLLVHALLVALAAAAQVSVSPGTGRVVGRIVDAATGSPIAGVSVSLQGPVSPAAPWPPTVPSLPPPGRPTAPLPPPDPNTLLIIGRLRSETNADGIFEIRDVPNGRWAIQARKEGYVAGPIVSMPGPLIEMVGGRSVTAPDVRLDRGGAVTGRVLDSRGHAMTAVQVVAVQMRRSSNGTIQITASSSSAPTNDLGEFRLAGLAPGDHYVVARPRPTMVPLAADLIGPPPPVVSSTTYVATYYPGATDAALAGPVRVSSNGTTVAIDFSMQSVPAYQVSGVVVDSAGRPVSGAVVRLAPVGTPFATSFSGGPSAGNGSFRVINVPAGTYGAMAAVPNIIRNGRSVSGSLSFGAAARPGAAPEVTIQGDTTSLRIVVSQP